jgi:triphosphatase
MGKEVELKYRIESRAAFEAFISSETIDPLLDKDSFNDLNMKAIYYDTESGALQKNKIAFRIRKEGEKIVSSIKWDDESLERRGFFKRSEINVPIDDDTCFFKPKLDVFAGSEIGTIVSGLVGASELLPLFETVYKRDCVRLDYDDSIFEASFDEGNIIASQSAGGLNIGSGKKRRAEKKEKISELEIELYHGDENALKKFAGLLEKEFDFKHETKSKFARGLALLGR